ncbi:histidine phosphatase family protein [Lactovum miscens]|uniref:Putative phosphoglycerate mutase n=1 Tax=Lactovum miscens TaxID=190387 RepID=A0A841CBD3_9LACT|nr:histidine phosphatase family protein [Lactovum miscens]MBB5888699.1 putative phosphoglycerate mutase [Lactovum miscens]
MVTIYLMRHGETTANADHQMQGWTNSPLTERGSRGIREIGKNLTVNFDAAYSSDSGRAIETAKLILSEMGLSDIEIHTDKRLREWSLGSFEMKSVSKVGGALLPRALKKSHFRRPTFEDFAESLHDLDTTGETESWAQIDTRIHSVMKDIINSEANEILVVSHGFFIATVLGMTKENTKAKFGMKNGQIFRILFSDGKFKLIE